MAGQPTPIPHHRSFRDEAQDSLANYQSSKGKKKGKEMRKRRKLSPQPPQRPPTPNNHTDGILDDDDVYNPL